MGFSRQEYWSGLPCPPPGDLPDPGIKPASFCLLHWQMGSLPLAPPGKTFSVLGWESAQLCPTLCDPTDGSLPGSVVHGIFQARILECVAMPSSRGSSRPRDQTCISYVSYIGRQILYPLSHLGTPYDGYTKDRYGAVGPRIGEQLMT